MVLQLSLGDLTLQKSSAMIHMSASIQAMPLVYSTFSSPSLLLSEELMATSPLDAVFPDHSPSAVYSLLTDQKN